MGELTEHGVVLKRAYARLRYLEECQRYENSLLDFASYVWPVVEPAIPFVKGWVLEAVCEHLEAVTKGHIKKLLINVPPGFTKSLMTDVFWPAWEWGPRNMPHMRYVCASYSNHITERDNMRCRNIVLSERYRRLWGHRFKISNEQFTKVKFANDHTGWKLATSVGGIGVGERGDRFIIDDGNNTMDMESEATRDNTNIWFTEVVPTRLNNMKESAIVIIQQRLHEEDISGMAITRNMGYTHLMIPMEHDPKRHCITWLGDKQWEDPRTKDQELAWVDRFPEEVVTQIKNDIGPIAYAGQFQQTPEPRGGAIINRDYWKLWEEPKYPNFDYLLASVDTAYTEKEENDPSAMTIWGVFRDAQNNPKVMLIWAWEGRLEMNNLVQHIIDVCSISQKPKKFPQFPVDRVVIESKGTGISVSQELYRLASFNTKFGIDLIDPKRYGDKVARLQSIQHIFATGMVYAPDKEWADMVIHQCAVFPRAKHDDLVDTTSQGIRYLRDLGLLQRNEEQLMEDQAQMTYPGRQEALYPV